MKRWIITFFNKIQSNAEFSDSLLQLRNWFKSNEGCFTESQKEIVSYVLESIVENIEYCGNHKFIDRVTFNFQGDSIAESSNTKLKCGTVHVNGRQNIDASSLLR